MMKKRKKQLKADSDSGPQLAKRANAMLVRPPGLFSGAGLNGGMNPVENSAMGAPKVTDQVTRRSLQMQRPRGRG